ncbi:small ribosomal subunit protein mS46 [Monosporozyma unispora]
MSKLVMMQKVPRAMYSTEITQDFLKDLLNRAKKATTLSAKNPNNNNNNYKRDNTRNNYNNNSNNNRDRARTFARGKRPFNKKFVDGKRPQQTNNIRQQDKVNNVPFHPMTSNVSQETLLNNMPKQPQFQNGTKSIDGLDNDLLDVLDAGEGTTTIPTKRFNKPNFTERRRKPRFNNNNANKNSLSGFIYMKPISPGVGKNLNKLTELNGPQEFQLNSINTVDLFKYYPSLNVNPKSQWVSFILSSMNEAQFPLYREPNVSYANLIKNQLEGPVKPNDIFTVKTPGFGNYTYENSYSVNVEREPLVENIDVSLNKDKFNEMVLGKYEQVDSTSSNNNNLRVKLSLQNCSNLSNNDKDWLYQVCSGFIPLNQVTK